MTKNEIDYLAMKESQRHNQVMEKETERHNRRDESVRSRANDVTREGVLVNQSTQLAQLRELNRHNVIVESESIRHNLQDELMRHESNMVNYTTAMKQAQVNQQVGAWNYEVGSRNATTASSEYFLRKDQLDETIRHNVKGEKIEGFKALAGAVNGMVSSVARMASAVIPY